MSTESAISEYWVSTELVVGERSLTGAPTHKSGIASSAGLHWNPSDEYVQSSVREIVCVYMYVCIRKRNRDRVCNQCKLSTSTVLTQH